MKDNFSRFLIKFEGQPRSSLHRTKAELWRSLPPELRHHLILLKSTGPRTFPDSSETQSIADPIDAFLLKGPRVAEILQAVKDYCKRHKFVLTQLQIPLGSEPAAKHEIEERLRQAFSFSISQQLNGLEKPFIDLGAEPEISRRMLNVSDRRSKTQFRSALGGDARYLCQLTSVRDAIVPEIPTAPGHGTKKPKPAAWNAVISSVKITNEEVCVAFEPKRIKARKLDFRRILADDKADWKKFHENSVVDLHELPGDCNRVVAARVEILSQGLEQGQILAFSKSLDSILGFFRQNQDVDQALPEALADWNPMQDPLFFQGQFGFDPVQRKDLIWCIVRSGFVVDGPNWPIITSSANLMAEAHVLNSGANEGQDPVVSAFSWALSWALNTQQGLASKPTLQALKTSKELSHGASLDFGSVEELNLRRNKVKAVQSAETAKLLLEDEKAAKRAVQPVLTASEDGAEDCSAEDREDREASHAASDTDCLAPKAAQHPESLKRPLDTTSTEAAAPSAKQLKPAPVLGAEAQYKVLNKADEASKPDSEDANHATPARSDLSVHAAAPYGRDTEHSAPAAVKKPKTDKKPAQTFDDAQWRAMLTPGAKQAYTVPELKAFLAANKKAVGGKKEVLVERAKECLGM
eukprot:CAMPEP_0184307978 /NCGR_PEP_ID=MMETSP1049-20130417/16562_1 /TAXON_ID=77928 /ORGANISM="Proteomonas sulcata, Strain CCMP704" /LENGTH=636 /DNA_ID=CAMNT_0026620583 /DNA_START=177 /DNA_END=2087 /DNA_ORIENTATION=-